MLTPAKQPGDGNQLDPDTRTYNMLLRALRCLGERGFALLAGRKTPLWGRGFARILAVESRKLLVANVHADGHGQRLAVKRFRCQDQPQVVGSFD